MAACALFPPGGLIKGSPCPVGHDRYMYGLKELGEPLAFLDRERYGLGLMQRMVGFSSVDMDRHRLTRPPHWYVGVPLPLACN